MFGNSILSECIHCVLRIYPSCPNFFPAHTTFVCLFYFFEMFGPTQKKHQRWPTLVTFKTNNSFFTLLLSLSFGWIIFYWKMYFLHFFTSFSSYIIFKIQFTISDRPAHFLNLFYLFYFFVYILQRFVLLPLPYPSHTGVIYILNIYERTRWKMYYYTKYTYEMIKKIYSILSIHLKLKHVSEYKLYIVIHPIYDAPTQPSTFSRYPSITHSSMSMWIAWLYTKIEHFLNVRMTMTHLIFVLVTNRIIFIVLKRKK